VDEIGTRLECSRRLSRRLPQETGDSDATEPTATELLKLFKTSAVVQPYDRVTRTIYFLTEYFTLLMMVKLINSHFPPGTLSHMEG
jgi:hypothetical protein